MNILHISNYFPPKSGGIERVAYDIIDMLKSSYNNIVLCFNKDKETIIETYNDIKVYRIGTKLTFLSQPISYKIYKVLKNIILKNAIEIIHLHAPNPLIYFYLKKIDFKGKIILHWHSDILGKSIFYKLIRPYENWVLNRSDIIIGTSNQYVENSKPIKNFLFKTRIVTNIVNTDRFDEYTLSINSISVDKTKINVIFVGRHVKYKGLKYLIEVAKIDKNSNDMFHFHICGEGPLTKKIMKDSKNLKNVTFYGNISNEKLYYYLNNMDIFAFPSITKSEAFGIALAEAMYYGLPAVTFEVLGSGLQTVNLNDVTGLVAKNRDSNDFYDKLILVSKNQKKYSIQAKKHVEKNFLKENMRKQIMQIYNNLIISNNQKEMN